jgi:hypothetical protein
VMTLNPARTPCPKQRSARPRRAPIRLVDTTGRVARQYVRLAREDDHRIVCSAIFSLAE